MSLHALNEPEPAPVKVEAGLPRAVQFRGSWRPVARTEEVWRVDDGWWRPRPVARTYFRVDLGDALVLTVYRDDEEGSWWIQRY